MAPIILLNAKTTWLAPQVKHVIYESGAFAKEVLDVLPLVARELDDLTVLWGVVQELRDPSSKSGIWVHVCAGGAFAAMMIQTA